MLTRSEIIEERIEPMAKIAAKKKKPARKPRTTGVVEGTEASNGASKQLEFPPAEQKKRGKAKSPERVQVEAYRSEHPTATASQIAEALGIEPKKAQQHLNNIKGAGGKKRGRNPGVRMSKASSALPKSGAGNKRNSGELIVCLTAASNLIKAAGGIDNAIKALEACRSIAGG
jgi:predicted HTH transcriptional regulator